jgi:hypothetical protein
MRKIKAMPLKKETETIQEFSNREQENMNGLYVARDDKQTFLAEPSTESNRICPERNIERYKENIYPSSSVGSPMICFEESSSNLFLNEKLPPLSGQREGKIKSNNFVTLSSQSTEKPYKNRLERTMFDSENTFSKDIILDGFSVACEGEDKFAVAREGKLPSHASEKSFKKK